MPNPKLNASGAGERRAVSSAKLPLSPTLSPSDGAREKPPADYGPTNNFGMHGRTDSDRVDWRMRWIAAAQRFTQ